MADAFINRTFENEEVDLSGRMVVGTEFRNCRVWLNMHPGGANVQYCTFDDCELLGDGWGKVVCDVDIRTGEVVHYEQVATD